MSDELNRALAEAMGLDVVDYHGPVRPYATTMPAQSGGHYRHYLTNNVEHESNVPPYSTDLNALRDGPERVLRASTDWALRVEYDPIAEMYTASWIGPYEHGFTPNAMFATEAEARASAALRALKALRALHDEGERLRAADAGTEVAVGYEREVK